jgi:sulfur-oxidizing protein SoxY
MKARRGDTEVTAAATTMVPTSAATAATPATAGTKTTRRTSLIALAALPSLIVVRPTRATPDSMKAAIEAWAGRATIREGRVELEVPPLVDNGNLVSIGVRVDSPMTQADHVREIAVFNDGNPQPDVVRLHFTPRSGRAAASLSIRLSTTQNLVAVARMSDGSLWQRRVEVVVVLAACIE